MFKLALKPSHTTEAEPPFFHMLPNVTPQSCLLLLITVAFGEPNVLRLKT